MEKCLNCGAELTGKYCSNCGQERIAGRMEVKHIFKDVTHGIFHWESSIFNTFKELIVRPGKFLRNYIAGTRKPYVKPFSYFIFIQTVYVIIFHWLSDKYFAFVNATMTTSGEVTETMVTKIHELQHFVTSNINYLNFLLPVIAAFYIKLFFKKKTEINYAESIVIALYINGTILFFAILLMPLTLLNSNIWSLRLLINLVYTIVVLVQFSGYPKFTGIIRAFFATMLSYLTLIIIVGILIICYLQYFKGMKFF